MSKWRPIETAPMDGTWLLVVKKGNWKPKIPYIPLVARWEQSLESWIDVKDDDDFAENGDVELGIYCPTHWMPLPDPPK